MWIVLFEGCSRGTWAWTMFGVGGLRCTTWTECAFGLVASSMNSPSLVLHVPKYCRLRCVPGTVRSSASLRTFSEGFKKNSSTLSLSLPPSVDLSVRVIRQVFLCQIEFTLLPWSHKRCGPWSWWLMCARVFECLSVVVCALGALLFSEEGTPRPSSGWRAAPRHLEASSHFQHPLRVATRHGEIGVQKWAFCGAV